MSEVKLVVYLLVALPLFSLAVTTHKGMAERNRSMGSNLRTSVSQMCGPFVRLVFVLFLFAFFVTASATEKENQPNIVLIISDYMGYQDIQPYGAADIQTPSLTRLANEGVMMTDFHAAAPVCGPSRAALYTGQYPARVGIEHNIRPETGGLSSSISTLPGWLKKAGYQTALFGKWHLGRLPDYSPMAHGFNEFFGHHEWTINYYNHKTSQGEPGLYKDDQLVDREGYLTDLLTEEAVRFIEENQDRPFFVTVSYNAALPPYQPPGLPESRWEEGWDVNKATRRDYVQMVERMDHGIGQILGKLDSSGVSDNTLVVYVYDHGGRDLVNSRPLFHGFATLWEGGIRIPAIMRLPDVLPANTKSSMSGIMMDVTATIIDVAGVEGVAIALDGVSLIPFLREEEPPPKRQLYWRNNSKGFGNQSAIREGKWKYIDDGNSQFLFDLNADIGERNNLFYEQQEVANRLRADLVSWSETFPEN